MNILMLGCGYGVPNYGSFGPEPHEHIEFLLKARGHAVHNCSVNGGTNLTILDRAQKFLAGLPIANHISKEYQCIDAGYIDLVIWFHTEVIRDKEHPFVVYKKYKKFFDSLQTKVAVIGGTGDVLSEFLHCFQPDFFIQSWRRVILDKDIPLSNTLSAILLDHTSIPSTADRLKIKEDNVAILHAMQQSSLFFDGFHPGAEAHQDLVQRLIDANLVT